MSHKIAFVTGATGAIGKAIASIIAENDDYEVVLICRNEDKARSAVSDIKNKTGNTKLSYELVDLSRWESIDLLARKWKKPIHVLVNNAAITPRRREETQKGIEMQFATNVLGYFWMIKVFEENLINSSPSRIVNVASYWAGDLDFDDLEFKKRPYDNNTAYRQSKQADRMLTLAFSERLKDYNVTVNACHPGDVNSKLSNDLGFGGHETPRQGADTPSWLAINDIGKENTGKYFENRRIVQCTFSKNHKLVDKLYKICDKYI
ncbi:MAG: SDR family NAD(P)-dependent oxidoreductase [Spirochaetota bacterium]|nr:SDR family NAD(P)-dependent oxidoreductase [Spirochaetota bacterium]